MSRAAASTAPAAAGASPGRRLPLVLAALAVAGLLAVYWPTAASIVAIWQRSETFAHGFVVFPISAWMIWQRRAALLAAEFRPDRRAVLLLAALGAGWLLAHAGGVLIVEQFAVVASIPLIAWGMLGRDAVRTILFPLAFLLFAVPVGEFLIPSLMDFTADFVVAALQLSGIPVYREGNFFTIPSGQWSVVEGCSGLRYLIASFMLGTLYAWLTYRSAGRRALFVLLAVLVPILANGLRAYMIVMIAHLSDMRLALGIDHYIYGWAFFGLVMLLLFWIGAFWREDDAPGPAAGVVRSAPAAVPRRGGFGLAFVALAAVALPWPLYARILDARGPAAVPGIAAPAEARGWQARPDPLAPWKPEFLNPSGEWLGSYARDGRAVGVYLAYYRTQRQDAELINSQNVMVRQKHPVWSNVGTSARPVALGGATVPVTETRLRSNGRRLLVWEWKRIGGRHMNDPYRGKLQLALARVLGMRDDGAAIVVFTDYEDDPAQAAPVLQRFVAGMLPQIEASLDRVSEDGHDR